jgi:hypothetical protein
VTEYEDAPLEELAESANEIIAKGGMIFQKWTCEACGERVTGAEPNVFCIEMAHEDCPTDPGHVTQTPTGNYLAMIPGSL